MSETVERERVERGAGLADLLEQVERLRPLIESGSAFGDAERRLSPEVLEAMKQAGFYRLAYPRAMGGTEMAPPDLMRVWEAIGAIDPSAAWNLLMTTAGVGTQICRLKREGIAEIFKDGPPIVAGGSGAPCRARAVDGGYAASGRVPYLSGAHEADWIGVGIRVMDGAAPVLDPATGLPEGGVTFVPRSEVEIVDTWHTLGMRGTGSVDVRLDDVFVPHYRVGKLGPLTDPPPEFDYAAIRMWPLLALLGEAVIAVGSASTAVERVVALADRKTPSYTAVRLRDRELAQYQVGKARARVEASRAVLYETCGLGHEEARAGSLMSRETKIRIQLAICFAAEACAEAARLASDAAGSSAFRNEFGFERHLRDLHTMNQHADKSPARYATAGGMMFGHETDWFFLSF